MTHPALTPGRTAVITGAASGIGLAAAKKFVGLGLKVCLADLPGEALDRAAAEVAALAAGGAAHVLAHATDVSVARDLAALKTAAYARFGEVAVLMNNAGVGQGGGALAPAERWRRLLDVNLWGVINGVQAFAPAMIEQGTPGLIINTGSKQGITTPPGDLAYNVSKAGLKVFTEGLAHELRSAPGAQVTGHLLIPGYTHTGITGGGPEKPPAAWSAEQVVDFMLESLDRGDFYILCPDNAVTRETDERRIQWSADDIIQNRPALSRWDPAYVDAFAAFMAGQRGGGA